MKLDWEKCPDERESLRLDRITSRLSLDRARNSRRIAQGLHVPINALADAEHVLDLHMRDVENCHHRRERALRFRSTDEKTEKDDENSLTSNGNSSMSQEMDLDDVTTLHQ